MVTKAISEYLLNFSRFFSRHPQTGLDRCLTDAEVARLIDDQVKTRERERFHHHLNECTECYQLWREIAAFVKSNATEPENLVHHKTTESQQTFRSRMFAPSIWAPVFGAAALVLVILWSGPARYEHNMNAAYNHIASQDHEQIQEMVRDLALQTQTNTMAFSQTPANAAQEAFAAGLQDGVQQLTPANSMTLPEEASASQLSNWNKTGLKDYYQFGRWIALVWIAAQTHSVDVNWKRLQNILAEIQSKLAGEAVDSKEKTVALGEIDRLQPLLDQAETAQRIDRKTLVRALSMTIAKLTPS